MFTIYWGVVFTYAIGAMLFSLIGFFVIKYAVKAALKEYDKEKNTL